MTDPYPGIPALAGLVAESEGRIPQSLPPALRRRRGRKYRGCLRLRVTAGSGFGPMPDNAPWAFVAMSDQLIWERCYCPWWHRIPYFDRRVHSDLP